MPRVFPLLLTLLPLTACGRDGVSLEGTLLEAGSAETVTIADYAEPFPIAESTFEIEDLRGDSVELRFEHADGEASRMRLAGLRAGRRVTLNGIWFDDGLAFADQAEVEGGGTIRVNGLRMGAAREVDGQTELTGRVLALSREDGTFLVRPHDESLPDLRVLLGIGSEIRTPEGDPVQFGLLAFGDTVTIRGMADSGYLLAAEIEARPRQQPVDVEVLGEPARPSELDLEEEWRERERREEAERRDDDDDDDERGRGSRAGGRGGPGGRRD